MTASLDINIVLFFLFLISMFACGYGFGNLVESKIIESLSIHEEEIEALCVTVDELYTGLEMVYNAFTGITVSEEQAREAAERAEYLLAIVDPPTQVEAAS